jgi:hypothetical protein
MQSSDAIAPACSNRASEGTWPRSCASARVSVIVTGPTALRPTPASAIVSPSSQTAADAAAIAQSPARRSTFSCAEPETIPPARSARRHDRLRRRALEARQRVRA